MVLSKRRNLPLVKYSDRDFESIKRSLNDYRRRYYPNISRDEGEASFDDMVIDLVSYVGDILSFYLDYSVNESFLDTAVEFNNVLRHGRALGYRFKGNPSSTGIETFYIIIPANSTGLGPDPRYIPILKKDSELGSVSGNGFILNEDVNFAKSSNPIIVARVDQNTGLPTAYAIKAYGSIISGRFLQEIIDVGDFTKFLRIRLAGQNVTEIVSVVDSQGNEYFEVDYLSQDIIYKSTGNSNDDRNSVNNTLRPFSVPRRFITERDRNTTYLQFGFGSDRDVASDPLIDPARVILDVHGKSYVTDPSFDPSNILGTNKLGIVPANTKLSIVYRTNTSENVNASPNSVAEVTNPILSFDNISTLDQQVIRAVVNSIECVNEKSITGDTTVPTVTELKFKIFDRFASQNRAVTVADYKSFIYSLPPKFGSVKRVNLIQDHHSFKRNLKMYVISENADQTLTTATTTLKNNLKVWLSQGKMISDSVDILDAKIVNLGISFIVTGEKEVNRFDIQNNTVEALRSLFQQKEDIGVPFSISEVYKTLIKVKGVVDVLRVKVFQKKGGQYSATVVDLDALTSADGTIISTPANCVFEVKYPDQDILGAVR